MLSSYEMSLRYRSFHKNSSLWLIILLFGVVACKPRTEQESQVKQVTLEDAKNSKAYKIMCKNNQLDETEQNVCLLKTFGEQLLASHRDFNDLQVRLKEYFSQQGIKNFLDPADLYSIQPRTSHACFNQQDFPVEPGWLVNRIKPLVRQMLQLTEFIYEYHKLVDGQDVPVFSIKNVDFCPIKNLDNRKMIFRGDTLTLGLPDKSGLVYANFGWYDFAEILRMWDEGDHLDRKGMLSKATAKIFGPNISVAWKILNPIGRVRTQLRKGLRVHGGRVGKMVKNVLQRLKNSTGANLLEDSSSTLNVLQEEMGLKTSSGTVNVDSPLFDAAIATPMLAGNGLIGKIVAAGKLKTFLDQLVCIANDKHKHSEFADSGIGGFLAQQKDDVEVQYDLKSSIITVANFHDINVSFFSNYSKNRRYIKQIERSSDRKFSYKVKSDAMINIITGDRINVDAVFQIVSSALESAVPTYALEVAARNTMTGLSHDGCQ